MTPSYTRFIGVDVAAKKLDLHDSKSGEHQTIDNTPEAIGDHFKGLRGRSKILVVAEATGGYERRLVDAMHELGIDVSINNPFQVRCLAKGLGVIEKNDPIDAGVIARFGQVAECRLTPKSRKGVRSRKPKVGQERMALFDV